MQEYRNMLASVKENGGNAKILIPCIQESIWDLVMKPTDAEEKWNPYKIELSLLATVYDMEWQSEISYSQDVFADGFHFAAIETYDDIYAQALWGNDKRYVRIYENGTLKE